MVRIFFLKVNLALFIFVLNNEKGPFFVERVEAQIEIKSSYMNEGINKTTLNQLGKHALKAGERKPGQLDKKGHERSDERSTTLVRSTLWENPCHGVTRKLAVFSLRPIENAKCEIILRT